MNQPQRSPETVEMETELVAYLDGELDHAAAQRVERRLSEDPEFRRRLQQLQRAWDLLDSLPRLEASKTFATTTVEMVAVKAAADSQQGVGQRRRQRFLGWAGKAAALAVAVLLGFVLVRQRLGAPERRFLADLPVIEHVDLYLNADDVEFLKQLRRAGLFDTDASDAAFASTKSGDSIEQRRAYVAGLAPRELDELQRKREAFQQLAPETQQSLRVLHAAIQNDAQVDDLRHTLQQYSGWLRTLPAGRRAELLSLATDERVGQIRQLLEQQRREQEQRMPRLTGRSLKGDDAKVLAQWLDNIIAQHEEELSNLVPPGFFRDRFRQITDPQRRRASLLFTLARRMSEAGPPLDFPTDEDFEKLATQLSSPARSELEKLAARKERSELVLEWARSQYMSQFQPPQPSREELEKYFREEVSPNDRAWLEGLPPERFAQELRRHYQMHTMRRTFDPQRFGPGKPGGGGGPGRGNKGGGPPPSKPDDRGTPPPKSESRGERLENP